MKKHDNSFINLNVYIDQIDIDPRLVEYFKEAMREIQAYFNKKGYVADRDYAAFFKEFLLNKDKSKNLKIVVSTKEDEMKPDGFYNGKKICINEKLFEETNNEEEKKENYTIIKHTLIHEFIHFLVHHEARINGQKENPTFVDEALTEMLARQIDPIKETDGSSYQPQVAMMRFANIISGNRNNFKKFLLGKIDAKVEKRYWYEFIDLATKYHEENFPKGYFHLFEARKDENYIECQRKLISTFFPITEIKSFEDFKKLITTISKRPVKDKEFTEKTVSSAARTLIAVKGESNRIIKDFLYKKIATYREDQEILDYAEKTDFHIFKAKSGKKVVLLKDAKDKGTGFEVIGEDCKYKSKADFGKGKNKITFGVNEPNEETIEYDEKDLDFKKDRENIEEEQKHIEKYFDDHAVIDQKQILQLIQDKDLVSLDRFIVPAVGEKEKRRCIYIARYKDRAAILSPWAKLTGERVEDVNYYDFLGTVGNPKEGNAASWIQDIGIIKEGRVIEYKTEFMDEPEKMLLSVDENGLNLTRFHDSGIKTAYASEKECLIDMQDKENGLYTELFEELQKDYEERNKEESKKKEILTQKYKKMGISKETVNKAFEQIKENVEKNKENQKDEKDKDDD